jgi:hypothetical protein
MRLGTKTARASFVVAHLSVQSQSLGEWFLNFGTTSKHAKGKGLRRRDYFLFGGAVRHDTWKIQHVRDPAPVILAFRFHFIYNVRHVAILTLPWPRVSLLPDLCSLRAPLLARPRDKAREKSPG